MSTERRPRPGAQAWMCCPVGWKPFHTSCYYLSSDTKPWGESQKNCTGMGSHLVVISTEAEQNFLLSWVKDVTDRQSKDSIKDFLLNLLKGTITGRQERSYYIGLSSQKVEGQWHWVDQTPYNQATTFWRPKEPSFLDNETCTVFHMDINQQGNRNWKNNPCTHDFYRICETTAANI
ncbi:C-type lectin domain family 4 member D-like isoform X2 [Alligator sinensis]|uniref:C-type lectin domain family 4 member D-like isoform X2 n=1 Tax=Alligator sinensis TaxID=38654 RepID=A0A3Q0H9Y0_ALLSI|nr:C-type lectin domain family 4 member D-like isoform X2 [Alligator sinensis]